MTELRYDERVAIITGAGGGLGRSHALLLASRGAMVVVNDLGGAIDGTGSDKGAAQLVVDEITAAGGIAVANTDSVATPEGGEAIVQTALDEFGRVDIVVNNAGILRDKAFHNQTVDTINAVIDVHLRGAFYVTLPAYRYMRETGYGRIVMTTSPAGLFGNFGQTNYAAAKMGLVGFARAIGQEGGSKGVHANVISPTAATRMTEGLLGTLSDDTGPEYISAVVAYLCHESCELQGEVLAAAAGRVARCFVGVTPGYMNRDLTAEDVAENLDTIMAEEGYTVPTRVGDEMKLIAQALKDNPA